MNLQLLGDCLLLVFLLVAIACVAGAILWEMDGRRDRTVEPNEITVVCMDCGKHICGPDPERTIAPFSHGICSACAEVRREELNQRFAEYL